MRYRWFAEKEGEDEREEDLQEKPEPSSDGKKRRALSRMELFGTLLSVAVLLYGMAVEDVPIIYFSLAFLVHELRSFAVLLGEPAGTFLGNMLRSLSIVLFLGAFFLTFF
ncbi:MAG: hypothetical protein IKO94_00740 [Selenomonadaceae bacterium]|nr:hypothetical protein [Selenomonadaceae bacterium]